MRGGRGAGDGVMRSTQGAFHVSVLPVLFSASWAVSFEAAILLSECRGGELACDEFDSHNQGQMCLSFCVLSSLRQIQTLLFIGCDMVPGDTCKVMCRSCLNQGMLKSAVLSGMRICPVRKDLREVSAFVTAVSGGVLFFELMKLVGLVLLFPCGSEYCSGNRDERLLWISEQLMPY